MRKLQDSILSLLVHIIILFNIERIDFNGTNVINLATAVYILTVIAILLILTVKWLSNLRQPVLVGLAAFVYFAMKVALLSSRPLVGGIYTYLSFTELGLFLVAVVLAQNLAIAMKDLEESTKVFSLANVHKVKGIRDAYKEIEAEIYRSRRFHRPISVLVLEQNTEGIQSNLDNLTKDAQRTMIEQYFSVILAKELVKQLRETDLVLENDKNGRLVILSPDTSMPQAETLMSRLNSRIQNTEVSINFGAATFPDHALTFEQLLEHAEMNLEQRANKHLKADILRNT